jgi:hypothetical protein
MNFDPAAKCSCLRCGAAFFAEHGFSAQFCKETCAVPATVLPDDDDGYDGLPFDPDSGEHHCVFPTRGCDLDALPDEWRSEAAQIVARLERLDYPRGEYSGCACGHSHRVLARSEVRALRLAGFVVTAERDAECAEYPRDRSWQDDRDGRYENDDDWFSATRWLEGMFDGNGPVDCISLPEIIEREYALLLAELNDELEAIESLGFSLPSGDREFIDGDAPVAAPVVRAATRVTHTIVGVFSVSLGFDGRWELRHRFGGLVPDGNDGHASVRKFAKRDAAVATAESAMLALGMPVQNRRAA